MPYVTSLCSTSPTGFGQYVFNDDQAEFVKVFYVRDLNSP